MVSETIWRRLMGWLSVWHFVAMSEESELILISSKNCLFWVGLMSSDGERGQGDARIET